MYVFDQKWRRFFKASVEYFSGFSFISLVSVTSHRNHRLLLLREQIVTSLWKIETGKVSPPALLPGDYCRASITVSLYLLCTSPTRGGNTWWYIYLTLSRDDNSDLSLVFSRSTWHIQRVTFVFVALHCQGSLQQTTSLTSFHHLRSLLVFFFVRQLISTVDSKKCRTSFTVTVCLLPLSLLFCLFGIPSDSLTFCFTLQ